MRLIELNFAAIGPFPTEQRIRFADFEAAGLYLLRGSTGSGKSTIIDAILFALYGDAAVKITSSALRLRSNFAAKDTVSYAELIFEVPSGVYRIHRTPAYLKPGNKNATPATAVLEKLVLIEEQVVSREPLAVKPRDVNDLVPQIVGIAAEQFLQTVVLPQGKFAEFVRATPDARKVLLQQIFKTGQFNQFSELLRERARNARNDYDKLQTRIQQLAVTMLGMEAGELPAAELLSAADETVAEALLQVRQLRSDAVASTQLSVSAKAHLREAILKTELKTKFIEVSAKHAELIAQKTKFAKLAADLTAAEAAQPVLGAADSLEKAFANTEELLENLGAEFSSLSTAEISDILTQQQTQLTTALQTEAELKNQLITVGQLDEKHRQLESKIVEVKQLEDTNTLYDSRLSAAAQPMLQQKESIENLESAASGLADLEEKLEAVLESLKIVEQADAKRRELVESAENIGLLKRQFEAAKRETENVWQSWRENTAGVLAAKLKPGEACFVCGSTDHPQLAGETANEETNTQSLAEALEAENQANLRLLTEQERHKQLTGEITALNLKAGKMRVTLEAEQQDLEAQIAVAKLNLAAAAKARKDYEAAQAALDNIRSEVERNQIRIDEGYKVIASIQEDIVKLTEQTTGLSTADLTVKATQLRNEILELQDLTNQLTELVSHRKLIQQCQSALEQALMESSFTSVEQARKVVEKVTPIEANFRLLADFEADLKYTQSHYDKIVTQAALIGDLPQISNLKDTVERIENRLKQILTLLASSEARLNILTEQAQHLRRLLNEATELENTNGVLLRLSGLANGAKSVSGVEIPLSTWVLMERFEAVIAAANPFIQKFSGSRFKLIRVDDDANSKARHGGLGIAVYDSETDQMRPSKTLSGGETFYVSLALALGLAEVVSAEAGGIDFRSMLIDEGFGTLDPETLDKVLEGIKQINHSGRTVGIVSHVEELRRRISDGIEVTPLPSGGSTLKVYA